MPSASLAVAHRPHPDRVRVAGLSVAIALNLIVLLAAMRPLAPQLVAAMKVPDAITITWHQPAPPPQPPPPIELTPLPHTAPAPISRVTPLPVPAPVVTAVDTGTVTVPPQVAPAITPTAVQGAPATASPVEASLAYLKAPIHFPPDAIRRRLQGTVLLRVLVDESGKPVDVAIERSSGSALLDRSARSQVLAGWQFQPAVVDGRHVRAWARVPVTFNLREL